MSILNILDSGLQLESLPNSSEFFPLQAFGITLDNGMIEEMIRCVQGGQNVELTLGSTPVSLFSISTGRYTSTLD